jgi:hypothetical protein
VEKKERKKRGEEGGNVKISRDLSPSCMEMAIWVKIGVSNSMTTTHLKKKNTPLPFWEMPKKIAVRIWRRTTFGRREGKEWEQGSSSRKEDGFM